MMPDHVAGGIAWRLIFAEVACPVTVLEFRRIFRAKRRAASLGSRT
jgi:hypothetical protein